MDREQLEKRFDEWLDLAAADFGRAKPRPGLEARIVARLHSRLMPRPWWRRWQIMTAAAAAVLILSISVSLVRFQDRRTQTVVSKDKAGETPGLKPYASGKSAIAKQQPGRIAVSRHAELPRPSTPETASTRLPRQVVFPSAGLSDQDRLLLAYARAVSEGTVAGLLDRDLSRPIEIPKLEIPLLEIPKLEIAPIKIEPLPGETGDLRK